MASPTWRSSCPRIVARHEERAIRLFFAIELGAELLDLLDAATSAMVAEFSELAWVMRDKRHLTLKFLGDAEPERAGELAAAADRVAARHRALEMRVGEIGAFPNFRRARVVWTGVEQDPRLELLHHDLELACEETGFEVEGRPFRPHITLARIRATLPLERARALARMARGVELGGVELVDRITLFESTLAPSGARYRRLHSAILGGR